MKNLLLFLLIIFFIYSCKFDDYDDASLDNPLGICVDGLAINKVAPK